MWRIRMETYDEIDLRQRELDIAVRSLRKTGTEYANAERNYKKALRQKALELRDGGMPVTLIDKVIYGEEEVANQNQNYIKELYKEPLIQNLPYAIPANEINLHAKSGILIDAATGWILYEKNADEKAYPASTTKILTALVASVKATKPTFLGIIEFILLFFILSALRPDKSVLPFPDGHEYPDIYPLPSERCGHIDPCLETPGSSL